MLKSFVAGIGIFLAGLFGSPHLQPVVPLHDQPAAATVALFPIEGVTPNLATTTQDSSFTNATTTIVNNYITKPVIERIVERTMPSASSGITSSELDARLQELTGKFSTQLAGIAAVNAAAPNNFVTIPVFAQAQRIDNLANVTISNATVNGISGLTASNIPDLSGTYLPLSGGTLTFASSTRLSVFGSAYFGGTATSSFDSTGALTLATPLLVSSGGTGANTFGQGWLYSNGSTGALAASTSPTVNYITATSTTRPNYFASFLDTSGTTGGYKIDGNLVLQASTTLFSTFVGRNAGNSSMTGINNTGLGDSALSSNTTGSWNSAFGFSALSANTTGSWNTAYGWSALLSNTTADANVGIGYYALRSNTTGRENTAVGSVALQFNTTGNYNEAVGYQALWQNTTGGQNAANGYQALIYNTTGSDNTGTGYSALWSNTTGSSNTSTGFQALVLNTTGNYNTATGVDALLSNTTGSQNTAEGMNALANGTSTNSNVAVGFNSLRNAQSNNNVAIGLNSGYGITTGTKNLLIGESSIAASYNQITTGSNNIAIGNDVAVASSTLSNQLNIGNFIYGTGLSGTGSTVSSGSIGIGTTTPWRTLSVTGTVGFDGLTGNFGAGSLCLTANKEVVYNAGSDSCLSSLRSTKHDITSLTVDAFSQVAALQPVSFVYNNDASSTVRYGFIAEDSAAIDTHLGTYDANGNLSGVDDRGLLAIIVRALQSLIGKVANFADSFTTKELTFTRATGDEIDVHRAIADELCANKSDGTPVCVSGDQLAAVLAGASATGSTSAPSGASTMLAPDTTPPTITINGENPAHIYVGDSYADLDASVTDNVDKNLGLKYFLNGALVSNIVIDTSAAATDTIDYVATDQAGNTATSTRSVIVEVATSTSQ